MSEILHQEERKQFERLLLQQGVGRVADRLAVLEAFLGVEDHLGEEELVRLLASQGHELEPDFVVQTLEMLTRYGLATRRQFEGRPPIYEHRHLGDHHDHLICTRCGAISEFHDPRLEELKLQAARDKGFHHLSHRLQIYGLCRKCLAQRQPTMPLALASPGEKVRVERITGGDEVARHLSDLGLTPGAEVEVISSGGGPMVLAVRGSRVALGRGVGHKVHVSQVNGGH